MFEGSDAISQFDIAVIIIILLSSVFAFLRGFLKETLVLTGWVGATAITIYVFPHAAEWIGEFFKSSKVVNIAAITLVFLAVLTLISIINAMILDNLREMRLGIIDRSLGFLFGLLRGALIASIIHFAIVVLHVDDEGPEWLTDGTTYNITIIGAEAIKGVADTLKESDMLGATDELLEGDGESSEDVLEEIEDTYDEEYEDFVDDE